MEEALVESGPKVRVVDSPIPKPGTGQVLVKVVVAGSNPKDRKRPENWGSKAIGNHGDDMAGIVHEVGKGVSGFRPGDRPGGAYAEYGLSWAYTTFRLPTNISFEEGAAIPLAALTAACGLYARLGPPESWMPVPTTKRTPLVFWGASSAVSSYAIQLAKRSNIHPLPCVAGRAQAHIESLIDKRKGDTVIDYRQGYDIVVQAIRASLKGAKLEYAFDAVSKSGSYQTICEVLDKNTGKITLIVPAQSCSDIPKTIEKSVTKVADINGDLKDLGYVYARYFSKGLEEGWFKVQPQGTVPGGLVCRQVWKI